MKRILYPCLIVIMVVSLCSCAKVIGETKEVVEAKVVNVDYSGSWNQMIPVRTGKVTTYTTVHHPANYNVTVRYNDITQTFDNEELYNQYVDKIGESISVVLVTTKYDDNTVKFRLEEEVL